MSATSYPVTGTTIAERVAALDWERIGRDLDEQGYAVTPTVLTADECRAVEVIYDDEADGTFRSVIDMRHHRYGSGVYKYFDRPLPGIVDELRTSMYPPLAEVANRWMERLGRPDRYPEKLDEFLETCHGEGQLRPTPLLFRYGVDDFNALHQDVYGSVAFPLQAVTVLDRPGVDFTGGEILLVTQMPRAQSVGEVVVPDRGQFLIFPNAARPVVGARGDLAANVRHGVSRVRTGQRHTLGIIFHDAT